MSVEEQKREGRKSDEISKLGFQFRRVYDKIARFGDCKSIIQIIKPISSLLQKSRTICYFFRASPLIESAS
ncbi:hypothetical protein AKJ16_DCAP14374 [Drosera capensis]